MQSTPPPHASPPNETAMPPGEPLNRRDFTRLVTAGTLAGSLAAAVPPPSRAGQVSDEAPVRAPRPNDVAPATPERAPDAAALLAQVIQARYPQAALSKALLNEIRSDISGDLFRSIMLSSFPLSNSDEPGFVFAAYRGDD